MTGKLRSLPTGTVTFLFTDIERLATQDVVLLCACANVATCHRLVLAEEAVRRMPSLEVIHLQAGLGL